jgi:hypothetical protein
VPLIGVIFGIIYGRMGERLINFSGETGSGLDAYGFCTGRGFLKIEGLSIA